MDHGRVDPGAGEAMSWGFGDASNWSCSGGRKPLCPGMYMVDFLNWLLVQYGASLEKSFPP